MTWQRGHCSVTAFALAAPTNPNTNPEQKVLWDTCTFFLCSVGCTCVHEKGCNPDFQQDLGLYPFEKNLIERTHYKAKIQIERNVLHITHF